MTPDARSSAERLRFAIQRLARDIRRHRRDGLSDSQLAVLFHLQRGDCFPGELAARENVSPPSINRTLNGLEAAGLLERHPALGDARRVRVSLTAEGGAVLDETRRLRDEWFAERLGALSGPERARLDDVVPLLLRLGEP